MSVENQYQIFLNSLPLDWSLSEISKLGAIVGGSTPSRENSLFWNGDIPWVTPGEVSGNQTKLLASTAEKITKAGLNGSGANLLPSGSLMITTRATLGARVINAVPMTTNQGFKSIVFRNDVDASFYYYLFEKIKSELVRRASGTTFLEISGSEFSKIAVPNPSNGEKRVIANILDTLDTTIRQTEAIIAKLQQVKQGLLHDLLTRGIDANGQLRPPVEQAPHLYKESPLGWIPREWEAKAFGQFAAKIQDGTHFSPNIRGGEYLYVTSKNIRFGYLDLSNVDKIDKVQHDAIYRRCDVKYGDLLLTKDGANTGNAAINTCIEQISLLSSVAFIRFNEKQDEAQFFFQYLLSPQGQQRMKDLMSGNAITRLTLQKIRGFCVPCPQFVEQEKIGHILATQDRDIYAQRELLNKLNQQKSALMDDLLTGRVRVMALISGETPVSKELERKSE